ncbi:SAM-dependent methyltransferase [Niameybacter massiliensis]|uniref:SAM-dependent methyltransferase n=1 Tax=Holtiella tumoricola TaxID=3018743 RepID=A0AA42DNX1_9FIRM|nr:SAM-dependent methyltransferase [Holtiella tumoricola]MDA3732524.1 SAM-dependent methyltransferase [Holtiella tumoricola]
MEKVIQLIETSLQEGHFIDAIWSNPRVKQDQYEKVTAKLIELKGTILVQCTLYKQNKAYHENVSFDQMGDFVRTNCNHFKQIQLYTATADYQALVNKKGEANMKRKAPTKQQIATLSHNRQKQYILNTDSSKGFLMKLGLMSEDGQIKPSKYDKYKQINKYLETIEAVMPSLAQDFIRIIDFGCGKSYLTFAMYHYLTEIQNKQVEIVGLDLKEDVIAFCNKLAEDLGYEYLKFQVGDIGKYTTNQAIDMVVSLHACNTATDAALAKAVGWDAKVILAVPCCHHECYTQIHTPLLDPILKHGILKEKIASFITDGMRSLYLEGMGYKVNVMEFIDMQHTPKNILIKAIKSNTANPKALETYHALSEGMHLDLTLPHLIDKNH